MNLLHLSVKAPQTGIAAVIFKFGLGVILFGCVMIIFVSTAAIILFGGEMGSSKVSISLIWFGVGSMMIGIIIMLLAQLYTSLTRGR
jgi:hypothetical protein